MLSVFYSRYSIAMGDETRSGLIIRAELENGVEAYSELAPLNEVGFSKELLPEALDQLRGLVSTLKTVRLPYTYQETERLLAEFGPIFPSLAWALETLLVDIGAQLTSCSYTEFLRGGAGRGPTELPINAMLQGSASVEQLRALRSQGFRTIKLKVGPASLSERQALLQELGAVPRDFSVRLDANRSLSLAEASELCLAAKASGCVEYIEEPLASTNSSDFIQLAALGVPLAIDETMFNHPALAGELLAGGAITVLVVKPLLFGGYGASLRQIETARSLVPELKVVLTSTMEAGPAYLAGLYSSAAIAAQIPVLPCGFDTLRSLATHFVVPSLYPQRGHIVLSEQPGLFRQLDLGRLRNWVEL